MNPSTEHSSKLNCAALAFHKSLIGISQLNALEEIEKNTSLSRLRSSKALYTYYAVYHMFCMCILISPPKYTDKLKLTIPIRYGQFSYDEIYNKSEKAENWNNFRDYETDWATSITHSNIRFFCRNLRKDKAKIKSYPPYIQILYENFIRDAEDNSKCLPGLFEKLNYIRDRVIYRPSYGLYEKSPNFYYPMQTSRELKNEIASIPTSKELYAILIKIYNSFLSLKKDDRDDIMLSIWGNFVEEKISYYNFKGDDIKKLEDIGCICNGGLINIPSYIAHILELEDINYAIKYTNEYWNPLKKMFYN